MRLFSLYPVRLSLLSLLLGGLCYVPAASAQSPSIDFKTSRGFIYTTGNDTLQPFIITVVNPGDSGIQNVQFSITMPAGLVLGSVDKECDETTVGGIKTLDCVVSYVGNQNIAVVDFFVDGPLSSTPGGLVTMQMSSDLAIVEPSVFEASLADGDRALRGSTLNLQLVRDILFDGNNNSIPDIDEVILQPGPESSFEEILAQQAVIDVLFLVSSTAESYLGNSVEPRVAQFITGTNELYRENQVNITMRSVGLDAVEYSAVGLLQESLDEMSAQSVDAFADLDERVLLSGADIVVLLHALPPNTDTLCGISSSEGIGRQGDYQPELHRGRLLTVIDVGPDCIDLNDIATSLALNMGIVATREEFPDGGTFSYSSGYGITDVLRTMATRSSSLDLGAAIDVNRFSNPDIVCADVTCGVDQANLALGANAVLSLNQTRHVVSALNDSVVPVSDEVFAARATPTNSNGIDLDVVHSTVETGALVGAFAEYLVSVTNTYSETLYDLRIHALHLNNGFIDISPQIYQYDDSVCDVWGSTLGDVATSAGALTEKSGRLTCFIDALAAGETREFSYFIQIDSVPPALDEEVNYYHELIFVNNTLQEESAVCIPVYTDLLDAQIGSDVCDVVSELEIATELGSGFLDLEAVPVIIGNLVSVPYIRLNDGSLLSAVFQIVNFEDPVLGDPELQLVSVEFINQNLVPLLESTFDEDTGHLSLLGVALTDAIYNVEMDLVVDSDPVRFNNLVLVEVADDGG